MRYKLQIIDQFIYTFIKMNNKSNIDLVHTVFLDEPNDHTGGSSFTTNLFKDIMEIKYALNHPQRKDDQLLECYVYFHPDAPIQAEQSVNKTCTGDYFVIKFDRRAIESDMNEEELNNLKIVHCRIKRKEKNGKVRCKLDQKLVEYLPQISGKYTVVSAIRILVVELIKSNILQDILYKSRIGSKFKHPRQLFQYINNQNTEIDLFDQVNKLDKTETKASESQLTPNIKI